MASRSLKAGDKVIALKELGGGVKQGALGVVVKVNSGFNYSVDVTFPGGRKLQGVKPENVEIA